MGSFVRCHYLNYLTELMEADWWRTVLYLQKQEKTVHDTRPASVFAPVCLNPSRFKISYFLPAVSQTSHIFSLLFRFVQCPHELTCPKLAHKFTTPCNFRQLYQALPLPGVRLNSGCTCLSTYITVTQLIHIFVSNQSVCSFIKLDIGF